MSFQRVCKHIHIREALWSYWYHPSDQENSHQGKAGVSETLEKHAEVSGNGRMANVPEFFTNGISMATPKQK